MRHALILAATVGAALAVAGSAATAQQASCSSSITVSGQRLIVLGKGVGCADAKPIARSLFSAPTIGTATVGGLRLLKLRSPRPGWTCLTTSPLRTKGAGCRKTGTTRQVTYINISAG